MTETPTEIGETVHEAGREIVALGNVWECTATSGIDDDAPIERTTTGIDRVDQSGPNWFCDAQQRRDRLLRLEPG